MSLLCSTVEIEVPDDLLNETFRKELPDLLSGILEGIDLAERIRSMHFASAERFRQHVNRSGWASEDYWEDSDYYEDWVSEVRMNDTREGFWPWLSDRLYGGWYDDE